VNHLVLAALLFGLNTPAWASRGDTAQVQEQVEYSAPAAQAATPKEEKLAFIFCVKVMDPVQALGVSFKWQCPKDGKHFADYGFCNRWCNSTGRGG
jgi:hypothetical protein